MKKDNPDIRPATSPDRRDVEGGGLSCGTAGHRSPYGLLGVLLVSLPALQAEAHVPDDSAAARGTPPASIHDQVASVRERLGIASEQDPRLKAAREEALRLSSGPDWSDWYNR